MQILQTLPSSYFEEKKEKYNQTNQETEQWDIMKTVVEDTLTIVKENKIQLELGTKKLSKVTFSFGDFDLQTASIISLTLKYFDQNKEKSILFEKYLKTPSTTLNLIDIFMTINPSFVDILPKELRSQIFKAA